MKWIEKLKVMFTQYLAFFTEESGEGRKGFKKDGRWKACFSANNNKNVACGVLER